MGASSRLRTLQYLPLLAHLGIEVEHQALLSDAYLGELYRTGARNFVTLAKAYLSRRSVLADAERFDAIWVEKEIYPYLLPWAEERLARRRIPFLLDYDDATFHTYDLSRHAVVRSLLGDKIDRIMRIANCVVAGNSYLAERARRAGAANIRIIPTTLDPDRYSVERTPQEPGTITVGWIGSPSTTQYVQAILPAVAAAAAKDPRIRLRLVGGGELSNPPMKIDSESWSEATEAQSLQKFDLGIMPLFDTPWEQGKCGYKLVQYMAAGIPVIAAPIGANLEIVEEGVTGLFARSHEEWTAAILALAGDAGRRADMGREGRKKALKKYSIHVVASDIAEAIRSCAGDPK